MGQLGDTDETDNWWERFEFDPVEEQHKDDEEQRKARGAEADNKDKQNDAYFVSKFVRNFPMIHGNPKRKYVDGMTIGMQLQHFNG